MFLGVITALITPFKEGKVDEEAFQNFVEWQIEMGVHGVIPCGTTGESPTLSHEEHNRVVALCVEVAKGKIPVIAGAGSNSTEEAIAMAQHAKVSGADAALVVVPYYNKPSQEGLYSHFKAIHDAVDIPIILYNVPGRSMVDITDDTIVRLAVLPRIVGIKDATGDLTRISTLRLLLEGRDFCQLSGDDPTALAFNAQGGQGCISVTANIAPEHCAALQNLWNEGKVKEALALHDRLMVLHNVMFCTSSPAPVKYAASLLDLCEADVRQPLLIPSHEQAVMIKDAVEAFDLL